MIKVVTAKPKPIPMGDQSPRAQILGLVLHIFIVAVTCWIWQCLLVIDENKRLSIFILINIAKKAK
jgi:hypothetical protein